MRLEADVLIPVYRPGNRLEILLEQLHTQTCPARKIILMNTEKQYFPAGLEGKYEDVEIHLMTRVLSQINHKHMPVSFFKSQKALGEYVGINVSATIVALLK